MRIENLSKTYYTSNKLPVYALKNISFTLPEKGLVFILGPSGSGKTTLLNLLAGIDSSTEGEILFRGRDILKMTPAETCEFRNTYCGFVFQDHGLLPKLSVKENVKLSLQMQGEKDIDEKVSNALSRVELKGFEERNVSELSGGQKQRVAIARAIVKDPEIIFADEPTGALDPKTGSAVFSLLKEISKDRLVVVVSHDQNAADTFSDRILKLQDGELILDTQREHKEDLLEGYRAKKAKMPQKAAFLLGASNLKCHKEKVLTALFLAIIAFILFSVPINIFMWDAEKDFIDAVYSSQCTLNHFDKYEEDESDLNLFERLLFVSSHSWVRAYFTEEDLTALREHSATPITRFCERSTELNEFADQMWHRKEQAYSERYQAACEEGAESYLYNLSGYVSLDSETWDMLNFSLLAGRLPENENEVAIPAGLYRTFEIFDYTSSNRDPFPRTVEVEEPEDMLGLDFLMSRGNFSTLKIVGVVETNCSKDCKEEDALAHRFHDYYYVHDTYLPLSELGTVLEMRTPKQRADFESMLAYLKSYRDGDAKMRLYNEYSFIQSAPQNVLVQMVRNASLLIGAVFLIISLIFLINFTTNSMKSQKREIGILRAMGIDTRGLLKIYLSGMLILCGIIFLLSTVGVLGFGAYINSIFKSKIGKANRVLEFPMHACRYSYLTPLVMLSVLLIVLFVGCVLPILHSRKKYSARLINEGLNS